MNTRSAKPQAQPRNQDGLEPLEISWRPYEAHIEELAGWASSLTPEGSSRLKEALARHAKRIEEIAALF